MGGYQCFGRGIYVDIEKTLNQFIPESYNSQTHKSKFTLQNLEDYLHAVGLAQVYLNEFEQIPQGFLLVGYSNNETVDNELNSDVTLDASNLIVILVDCYYQFQNWSFEQWKDPKLLLQMSSFYHPSNLQNKNIHNNLLKWKEFFILEDETDMSIFPFTCELFSQYILI